MSKENGGPAFVDKRAMQREFTDAFIRYQFRLDHPFPTAREELEMFAEFNSNAQFHARVQSLVAGVMGIACKHIDLAERSKP